MTRHPAAAPEKAPVCYHAAADTGADGHVHEVPKSLPRSVAPFTERRGDAIVFNYDRQAGLAYEQVAQRNALPAGERRNRENCPGLGI
jgi:hypothetical protein